MLVANILGDLIAVFVFKSLILVAIATLLFTLIGFILGIYFLREDIHISTKKLIQGGSDVFTKVKDLVVKKHGINDANKEVK
jgi:Na+-driven multidrug efflux pump